MFGLITVQNPTLILVYPAPSLLLMPPPKLNGLLHGRGGNRGLVGGGGRGGGRAGHDVGGLGCFRTISCQYLKQTRKNVKSFSQKK